VRYEDAVPAAWPLIVEALTDNRNRTSADVPFDLREICRRDGGCELGVLPVRSRRADVYPRSKGSDDQMLELAIELGASECVSTEEGHEFLTGLDDFIAVRDALEAKLGAPTSAAFTWRAQNLVAVRDEVARIC